MFNELSCQSKIKIDKQNKFNELVAKIKLK